MGSMMPCLLPSSLSLSILNLIMSRVQAAMLGLQSKGKAKRISEIITDFDIIELLTNKRYKLLILLCNKNKPIFKTFNSILNYYCKYITTHTQ